MSATRFVVVVGCQRSGTTLIGQMLGAHPDAWLVDEDDGAYALLDTVLQADAGDPFDALRTAAGGSARKYADGRTAPRPGATIVFKAPNATFSAPALAAATARHDVRIVFAVRDPRDVAASMATLTAVPMIRNQHRRMLAAPAIAAAFADEIATLADPAVPDHRKHALIWRVKSAQWPAFAAAPLGGLLVRYETLVADPDAGRRALFAHAGLDPAHADVAHDAVMQGIAIGSTDRTRAVDAASVGGWRRVLTPEQGAEVRAIAGTVADGFGYPAA